MLGNAAYLAAMSPSGELPADLAASMAHSLPPAPKRRVAHINESMDGVDIDRIHGTKRAAPRQLEAPVITAISELLRVHPRVLFAVRQNTGMASYEAKSGRYAPIQFYRKLTHGKELTITDFWGILKDGRMLAVEAKAAGFRGPKTDTELAQANFLALVRNAGGISLFATSADQVAAALA